MSVSSLEAWDILYIEDDEEDYVLTHKMLSQSQGRKFHIDWASTFEEGQSKLSKNHYDAVLVDYDLGSGSGIELIRQYSSTYNAPLILYTGRGSFDIDLEAMQAGATLYITKNEANPLLLERVIRYAVELKQRENDLRVARETAERELAERKRAEEAHQASEERLREFVDNTHDNFIALDHEWRFTFANRHYAEIMNLDPQDLLGKNYWEHFPQYVGTQLERNYLEVMEKRIPIHFRQNGIYTQRTFDVSIYPTREGIAIFSIDRTEEYRRQQQLENERARLDAVLQALPVGVWITDGNGKILLKNRQVDLIWGGDAPLSNSIEDYREYHSWDVITGRELGPEEYPMARALRTGHSLEPHELRIGRFDGSVGTILVSVEPIKNADGSLAGVVAINVDITDRKQAEVALRESEGKYQAIFQSAPFSIILARLDNGEIIDVNAAWQALFGVSREEAIGKTALELGTIPDPETRERGYQEMREYGKLHNFEMNFRDRMGKPFLALNNAEILEINGSKFLLSTTEDITEQRRAEEALRESERREKEIAGRFRGILENSLDVAYRRDLASDRYDYMSPVVEQVLGFTAQEMMDMCMEEALERIHPDDQLNVQAGLERATRLGRARLQYRFMHKNGNYRWVADHVTVTRDERGNLLHRTGILRDITERIQGEQALTESEEKLRLALDAAHMGTWVYDPKTGLIEFGERAQQLYRAEPGWVSHADICAHFLHPDDWPPMEAALQAAADPTGSGHYQMAYRIRQANGSWRWLSVWGQMEFTGHGADRRPVRMIGASRDVTAQKQASEDLQESQERLSSFLESTSDAFFALDSQFRFIYVNRRYGELIDREVKGLIGQVIWEVLPRYQGTFVEANLRRAMEERVVVRYHAEGLYTEKQFDISAYPTLDGLSVFCADRTQETLARQALETAYARLRFYIDSNVVGIVMAREDGTLIEINDYYLNLLGYTRAEFEQDPFDWRSITPPEHLSADELALAELRETGVCAPYEKEYFRKDGSRVWVYISDALLPDGNIAGFVNDISARKRAEEKMRQYAGQLERSNQALQDFAFIASHDLQEPLRKVQAFGSLLEKQYSAALGEEGRDYIARMTSATRRMRSMLDGLLAYSRVTTQSTPFVKINLNEVILDVLTDLDARILETGGKVELSCDLASLRADPVQMRQLFQNLIGNGLKYHHPDQPPVVQVSCGVDGDKQVVVQVHDNGIGFEMRYAHQIFEPFTRLSGRSEYEGSGMGLAICKKIVERHGGTITGESTPGQGSTFTVQLPFDPPILY